MNIDRYNELTDEYLALRDRSHNGIYESRLHFNEAARVHDTIFKEFLKDPFPFMQNIRCGMDVFPGWVPLLVKLCEDITEVLAKTPGLHFHVDQVKEKFGTLRFYGSAYSSSNEEDGRKFEMVTLPEHEAAKEEIHSLIYGAEMLSAVTCEFCNQPGKITGRGWIKTTCIVHAKS